MVVQLFGSKEQNHLFLFKNHNFTKMAEQLPIPPALKVAGGKVYVGHPKQIVDLLANGVATPILDISKTKGGMTLYKPKLRCGTLFSGNLEMYFLLDYPNQALSLESSPAEGKPAEVIYQLAKFDSRINAVDGPRALEYSESLDQALNFWAVLMEEEVKRVYPDKTASQIDRFAREGILSMKPAVFGTQTFELGSFLKEKCDAKKGVPCFKVGFGWVGSKEDPRSTEHPWGFKFELSPFPQYAPVARIRTKAVSAAEKQEAIVKKRKVEAESVVDSSA
jgi:hypothetical protein